MNRISKELVSDIFYLTPTQEGILFHYLKQPDGSQYFEQISIDFSGKIDFQVFKKSWQSIVDQNEMLRTVIRWEKIKKPVQIVLKSHIPKINYYDLSMFIKGSMTDLNQTDENDFINSINDEYGIIVNDLQNEGFVMLNNAIKEKSTEERFSFEDVPFRIHLVSYEDKSTMIISYNHILFDGWSLGILLKEFIGVYNSITQNKAYDFPPKLSFKNFISSLSDKSSKKEEGFWKRYLNDFDIELTTQEINEGAVLKRSNIKESISKSDYNKLVSYIKKQGITQATFFYGVWSIIDGYYNNKKDVLFGTTVSGRDMLLDDIENTIGLFINTIPVRVKLNDKKTVNHNMNDLQKSLNKWQSYKTTSLVNIKKFSQNQGRKELFDSLVIIENYPLDSNLLLSNSSNNQSVHINGYSMVESTNYDLTITINTFKKIEIDISYNSKVYKSSIIKGLLSDIIELIKLILNTDGEITLKDAISTISKNRLDDYKLVNQTAYNYPVNKLIHQLFEEQVLSQPNLTILESTSGNINCQDLNAQANQLAWTLKEKGVKTNDIVGILLYPSINMIIALLGVIKAGACYLPLDPSFPEERINYMLEDSKTEILICDDGIVLDYFKETIIDLSSPKAFHSNINNLEIINKPSDNLYVIYTSGSSGKPKGVVLSHQNVHNFICGISQKIAFRPYHKILCVTTFSFDIFVLETLLPIVKGVPIVIADKEEQQDLHKLGRLMISHDVNMMQTTPSRMQLLLAENECKESLKKMLCIMVGGEVFPLELLKNLQKVTKARIYNMYGPTETTVWSTVQELTNEKSISIGNPICNTSIYIFDKSNRLMPFGVTGEMCIGGDGVAKGYHNRTKLTDECFIKNSYDKNELIYKTGDLARWNEKGQLECFGRIDNQVKLRGFRIELGEIENVLMRHESINNAVVVVKQFSENDRRLIAYIISNSDVSTDELRLLVSENLPEYMMISHFVVVETFPMTANGKIDRMKLVTFSLTKKERKIQNPSSTIEQKVAEIWSEILGVSNLDIDQKFFDLGGHSLLTIQMVNMINERMDTSITVVDLFRYTTIRTLAKFLSNDNHQDEKGMRIESDRKHKKYDHCDIAVIGMSARFPGAESISEYWQLIKHGNEGISHFSDDELRKEGIAEDLINNSNYVKAKGLLDKVEYFDGSFFSYSPRESELMDPQIRILHECAWQAIEDAGYVPEKYDGSIGFYAGALTNAWWLNSLTSNITDPTEEWEAENLNANSVTTPISYKLNMKGPSVMVETACSTSLVSIHLACRSLIESNCDMAVAGGVSITFPKKAGYMYQDGMIRSKDGHCRVFDAEATGTLTGDGVGLVVLKRLDDALCDNDHIYAVVKSSAINNDGNRKIGYTAPSIEGQASVIKHAHKIANIDPETIAFIETHGTGTSIGDPIEIEGLKLAFETAKKQYCAVGSVKSNIGHLNSAAGVAGFIKAVLSIYHRCLPKSLHYKNPNPKIDFKNSPFYVQKETTALTMLETPLRAGVSSFGIGGTNAHVLLEESPKQKIDNKTKETLPNIFILSAKTLKSLEQKSLDMIDYLIQNNDIDFNDIIYTLQTSRDQFAYRKAFLCRSREDAIKKLILNSTITSGIFETYNHTIKKQVVFLFSNSVSFNVSYALKDLYNNVSTIKDTVDKCCLIIQNINGLDCKKVINESNQIRRDVNNELFESLLFIYQYTISEFLINTGVNPVAMLSHGLGEYILACVSKTVTFELAYTLFVKSSKLKSKILTNKSLNELNIEFKKYFSIIKSYIQEPELPYISCYSGKWITIAELRSVDYWLNHSTQAVQTKEGLSLLTLNKNRVYLDFGNKFIDTIDKNQYLSIFDIQTQNYTSSLIEVLTKLWCKGANIEWAQKYNITKRNKVSLPVYPFNGQYFWKYGNTNKNRSGIDSIKRKEPLPHWFYIPEWKQKPLQKSFIINKVQSWLIFSDGSILANSLINELETTNNQVISVEKGTDFESKNTASYIVNEHRKLDFSKLFESLNISGKLPDHIVYFWSVENDKKEFDSFYSFLYLVQELGYQKSLTNLNVSVITEELEHIGNQQHISPSKSLIKGLIKVVAQEYEHIKMKSIHIGDKEIHPESILREHIHGFEQEQYAEAVSYDEGKRYITYFKQIYLPQPTSSIKMLEDNDVVLITGGLGGIALQLAKYFSLQKPIKLVLVGRSEFPKESDWSDWLEEHGKDDEVSKKIVLLNSCIKHGAELQIYQADVSNYSEMKKVFLSVKDSYNKIDVIVHAAGIASGGIIQNLTVESLNKVLAPKVNGVFVLRDLDELVFDKKVRFMMLFSSINSIIGGFGQLAYTSSNIFLDYFAYHLTVTHGIPTYSINWDTWKEVGMAVKSLQLAKGKGYIQPIKIKHPQFHTKCILNNNQNKTEIEYEGLLSAENNWILNEHRLNNAPLIPATGYLDLIGNAIYDYYKTSTFFVKEVFFLRPLILQDKENRLIKIKISQKDTITDIEVLSRPDMLDDGWIKHVNASVLIEVNHAKTTIDLDKIRTECPVFVDYIKEEYNYHIGLLRYGLRWETVIDIFYGTNEGLAHLELQKSYVGDLQHSTIHPALMDVATTFMQSKVTEKSSDFVPFAYNGLKVYDKLEQEIYSYVRYDINKSNSKTLHFNVTITDSSGKLLISCDEFIMKKINESATNILTGSARTAVPNADNYRLETEKKGIIKDLKLSVCKRREVKANDVEIEVYATGLNFKDVLLGLGVLEIPEDVEPFFGLECSGKITAIGSNVKGLTVGNQVMAIVTSGFSKYVYVATNSVVRKPGNLTFEQGASIPMAFLTAYYALVKRGKLREDDRILIHAAAGGVGLAAVKIAQWIGAEVYATAGNEDKRDYLKSIGVKHVFNSRDTEFSNAILGLTDGKGVDVILNSLSGEALEKSVSILSPYGRFLEVGIRDILSNKELGMRIFEHGRSFVGINTANDIPDYLNIFKEMVAFFESGTFDCLPIRTYKLNEVSSAFEFMAKGLHIGKIVIIHRTEYDMQKLNESFGNIPEFLTTGITNNEGMEVIDRLVHSLKYIEPYQICNLVVSTHNLENRIKDSFSSGFQHMVNTVVKKQNDTITIERDSLKIAAEYVEPSTPIEVKLAEILKNYLALDIVGINDNFEELGIVSLDMIQINTKVNNALEADISVVDMYANPTIKTLSIFLGDNFKSIQEDNKAKKEEEQRIRSKRAFSATLNSLKIKT